MKKIICNADYATYVTDKFLQKRYPCKNGGIGVSNVNITKISAPRSYESLDKNHISFLTAGAIDVKYKGQQYMIKAMELLEKQGITCEYYLAGGGDKKCLANLAKKYRVEDRVHFLGGVPHEELLKKMRTIDFYIQPSLQEGLPRSVIEAMSCGSVCFGSTTAGIPELLDSKQVFKRGKVDSIVETVAGTLSSSDLNEISKRNIDFSRRFLSETLDERRFNYYKRIIDEIKGAGNGC